MIVSFYFPLLFLPTIQSIRLEAQTYEHIRRGKDLIGRARTGMGKTLAFAVPVIEKLLADGDAGKKPGRRPRVLVMAPTRELAKQVCVFVGVGVFEFGVTRFYRVHRAWHSCFWLFFDALGNRCFSLLLFSTVQ